MRKGILFALALLVAGFSCTGLAEHTGERAIYLSGNQTLVGCIYRPQGNGPFPAVVFSEGIPKPLGQSSAVDPYPQLAKMFLAKGYILFVPGRHGAIEPTPEKAGKKGKGKVAKHGVSHEEHAKNLSAAVNWLKAQHDVDEQRIAIIGETAGGIATLLALQHGLNPRAMVLVTPGARAIKSNYDFQMKLKDAVEAATAPIFLIQTENDANLLPKTVFGPVLEHKGKPNQVKVYPPFGGDDVDALHFVADGIGVWQKDVLTFLNAAMN